MKALKATWQLIKETLSSWSDDKAPRMGAALSYYTAFSLAPILVLAISIAGLAFGRDAAQGRILGQLEGLLGHDSAAVVQTMLAKASQRGSGVIAIVAGLVTLLIGATGVVIELQDAINTVWKVIPKPRRRCTPRTVFSGREALCFFMGNGARQVSARHRLVFLLAFALR